MPEPLRKVLHAFAALADLGEEIAETHDFEEMVRSALHVVLGALGIRRGLVAEFDQKAAELRLVATRGVRGRSPNDVLLSLAGTRRHGNGNGHGPSNGAR